MPHRAILYGEAVAPQTHDAAALHGKAFHPHAQIECTDREWAIWRLEQKQLMYLSQVLRALEGWKRLRPGQLMAWEGPGYDFESVYFRDKAGMKVSMEIEEDPIPGIKTTSVSVKTVAKRCVTGIASAITSASRSLCSLFKPAAPRPRSILKKKKKTLAANLPWNIPHVWSKGQASEVVPRRKKSVTFRELPEESFIQVVPRWISVTRDEWDAAQVISH